MPSISENIPLFYIKLWINAKPSPRSIYYTLNIIVFVLFMIALESTSKTFTNGMKYVKSRKHRSQKFENLRRSSPDYKATLHHVKVFDKKSTNEADKKTTSLYEMFGSPTQCKGHCTKHEYVCTKTPQKKFLSKQVLYQQPNWEIQVETKQQVDSPGGHHHRHRLIPRIIHQSWFKNISAAEHPNLSRVQNSWKSTGWEYRFYDDEAAAKYIADNFPEEVFQAYDDLRPGAFKADFFRYCALFLEGGLWADIDMQLQVNLDSFIEDHDGFIVPLDIDGYALHNAMIISAPGHPILAKAIEEATNMIRNRYTVIDMLGRYCPDFDDQVMRDHAPLFLTGPGLLAYAMKTTLGHPFSVPFEPGIIDKENGRKLLDLKAWGLGFMPGRTKILDRHLMYLGETRYTDVDKDLIIAGTDIEDVYDRRNKGEHYGQTKKGDRVWGLDDVYKDMKSADEQIQIQLVVG